MTSSQENRPRENRPKRRRSLVRLVVLLLVLFALYSAAWFWAAARVRSEAGKAVARLNAQGIQAECTNLAVSGYPLRFNVTCDDVAYQDDGHAIAATSGGIDATASLFTPLWPTLDLDGPRIARPLSRVTEYALDFSNPDEPTAQLVWQYSYPHRYAAFAGGQQRLANGNTLINWSQATDASGSGDPQPIATEVTSAGNQVWSVSAPGWFSYRATKADAPDRIGEAEAAGVVSVPALVVGGHVYHINFGASLDDVKAGPAS